MILQSCKAFQKSSDSSNIQTISESDEYTKTLGIEWNVSTDQFRIMITDLPPTDNVTKRVVSDMAKVFDVLGWFSPVTIKMKILLQRLWESKVDWDDPVIHKVWLQWRNELPTLAIMHIPRCYLLERLLCQGNCMVLVMLLRKPILKLFSCAW